MVEKPLYRHAAPTEVKVALGNTPVHHTLPMAKVHPRVVVLDPLETYKRTSQAVGGAGGQFGAVSPAEINSQDHAASPPTHLSLYSQAVPSRSKMSVQLNPSNTLGFRSKSNCTYVRISELSIRYRTFDESRQALTDHHEQQCPTHRLQGQDDRSKGTSLSSTRIYFKLIEL